MKLMQLLEYDYESDSKLVLKSRNAFAKLKEYIKNAAENSNKWERSDRWGGFVIPFSKIDNTYNKLIIVLADKNIGNAGFSKLKTSNYDGVIVLPILIEPFNLMYADTRLNKNMFVHEFTHYLDTKRYKSDIRSSSAKQLDAGNITKYLSSPAEFNAFFIETLESIENMFEDNSQLANKFLVDFNSFLTFFKTMFPQKLSDKFDDIYNKKFKKRVYNTYQQIKEKYKGI
jgi:hypothetical protein